MQSLCTLRGRNTVNSDACDSDFLNKALVNNNNVADVEAIIDKAINTPRQDAQPKTNKEASIEHRLNAEETLAKRYKAVRKAVIAVITEAIFWSYFC